MKSNLWRIILAVLIGSLVIYDLQYQHDHPPEIARVTDLKMGYYSHDEGTWIFPNQFPTTERRFKVCGYIEKSKPVDLFLTITEPNDKNAYLYQSQYFYKMDSSGEFCEMLYLSGEVVPDKYTLWVMDARRTAAQLEIEFIEK